MRAEMYQNSHLGFLEAGYNRINIDDCYMDSRDPKTNDLRADESRFPGTATHEVIILHANYCIGRSLVCCDFYLVIHLKT